jgi:hypothetical protein
MIFWDIMGTSRTIKIRFEMQFLWEGYDYFKLDTLEAIPEEVSL